MTTHQKQTLRASGPFPGSDFLVTGLTVIPATGKIQQDGAVAVRKGRLDEIGPTSDLQKKHADLPQLDGSGFWVTPGFVNAHTHAAMGFFRGLGHGRDQMIETFLIPAETSLTAELLEPLCYSYLIAGLRSGTTTFGDHYYFVDGVARALERLGLRGVVGETVADEGGAFPGRGPWERWKKTLANWPFSQRITPAVAPHAADTVSPSLFRELADAARAENLPLHFHLAQSDGEAARVQNAHGMSPVAYADHCNALGERTFAVHLVAAETSDLHLLADRGVHVGLCPTSQIIYERLAPLAELARTEVSLAVGTDCAASNDGSDMLVELKTTGLLAKDRGVPEAARSPEALLRMGTQGGAEALGLGKVTGDLVEGRVADLVFWEAPIDVEPAARPRTNLIYSMPSAAVRHVTIGGEWVLQHREPTQLAESSCRDHYHRAVGEIHRRLDDSGSAMRRQ